MSRRPVYLRIAEEIKAEWLTGARLRPGDRLPTQHELRKRYGASLPTIVRALGVLASEGLIRSRQGSGTYVAEVTPERRVRPVSTSFISFIAQLKDDWLSVRAFRGVERRAREHGYKLLTASASFSADHEARLIEEHLAAGAVGVVISPAVRERRHLAEDYMTRRWRDVPIVAIDMGQEYWDRPMVVFDNYRLGYDMTKALIQHGRRRIAFMHVSEEQLWNSVHERRQGWESALREEGIPIPPAYRGWPSPPRLETWVKGFDEDFGEITRELLSLDPVPDAVIAWEDHSAMQLIRALMEEGVKVPDDILVAGFDDHDATSYFYPRFPTSHPDFGRAGEIAVDIIHRILSGEPLRPRTYILPVPVIWRNPDDEVHPHHQPAKGSSHAGPVAAQPRMPENPLSVPPYP
ncbi:MAG: GntR family transcriptional regulator [Armatimonadota bacterium]|nr:MAG: GntR family transcriptional regulator [Armatimonadota bacterium]